ncbi:hypothetical protein BZG02_19120 [Labilibaculum filiforme]|uniref:Uncharacterized protein n=1 Tax=Labilibaculum filiforme TaxID=1940526 RepID=A0A2N3HQZ7_9BACT|nr:hypothetical protein [Labilibaculum filiforme]PKQ60469.1 hypothetical protein BZG02_19120 [Labilibaculum filiforme]
MNKQNPILIVDVDLNHYALYQKKETEVYYLVEINEIIQKSNTEDIIYQCYSTTYTKENDRYVVRLNDNGLTLEISNDDLQSVPVKCNPF